MRRISNARLLGREGLYDLEIDPLGRVGAVGPAIATAEPGLDLAGDWLSLGGVDLQINGALGLEFPNLTPAALPKLAAISTLLWEQGVDGYLPTLVTAPTAKVRTALQAIAAYMQTEPEPDRARVLGAHLEGPFLNPAKRGAHPQEYLQLPTPTNLEALIGAWGDCVRVMTLAAELDPTGETIAALRARGIAVSLGHSLATAAEADLAFARGATLVTHAFNAMPSLHHREPGLLGAALARTGDIRCGFIADGQHICPTALHLLLRAGEGARGLFLVSDALAALGLPAGAYPWGERTVTAEAGTARLDDGTLAGTTLPLLAGVQNLVRWEICAPEVAIALATTAPRAALGLATELVGQPAANLLRWTEGPRNLQWQRPVRSPEPVANAVDWG